MAKKKQTQATELASLKPLLGSWTIEGWFKNDKEKEVNGWEKYNLAKNGKSITCQWVINTITPEEKDVNKGKMKIAPDEDGEEIVGVAKDSGGGTTEYTVAIKNGVFSITNKEYRFTGKLNRNKDKITGKWETKSGAGRWKYWYDKILIKG